MGFFVIVAIAVVGAGIAIAVAGQQRNAQLAAWKTAAERLGIGVEPGSMTKPMRLTGSVDGFDTEVSIHRQSSGKSSQAYTRYRVSYRPIGLGLRLARQSGYTKLIRFFGAQDHIIGDETFDASFEIKAVDPTAVAAFLTAGRREALLRLLASHPEVVISDDETMLQRPGVERDIDVLVSTVRRLTAAAATLTDERLVDRIRRKIEQRTAGDLAASVPIIEVQPHPDDVDDALLTVEGLYGSGRRDEAGTLADALHRLLPADPDVRGLRDQVSQALPQHPPQRPTSTDPVAIAGELFGENRLSFETTSLFDERFAGTPVAWSGTVKRSTLSDADRDFGGGPITKAVVRIATIAHDLYGQAEVDAIVAFPPNVRLTDGSEVTFRGRLVKVDGLIRNLFVADGELV